MFFGKRLLKDILETVEKSKRALICVKARYNYEHVGYEHTITDLIMSDNCQDFEDEIIALGNVSKSTKDTLEMLERYNKLLDTQISDIKKAISQDPASVDIRDLYSKISDDSELLANNFEDEMERYEDKHYSLLENYLEKYPQEGLVMKGDE